MRICNQQCDISVCLWIAKKHSQIVVLSVNNLCGWKWENGIFTHFHPMSSHLPAAWARSCLVHAWARTSPSSSNPVVPVTGHL